MVTVTSTSYSKNLYSPFLWIGFNYFKVAVPLTGGSLLLTTKASEGLGIFY